MVESEILNGKVWQMLPSGSMRMGLASELHTHPFLTEPSHIDIVLPTMQPMT
jgi:hypothetical protein